MCCLFGHKWGEWRCHGRQSTKGFYHYSWMDRRCNRCGKIQMDTVVLPLSYGFAVERLEKIDAVALKAERDKPRYQYEGAT
jgi:hypothetical protein